jgi:hypothetical protein
MSPVGAVSFERTSVGEGVGMVCPGQMIHEDGNTCITRTAGIERDEPELYDGRIWPVPPGQDDDDADNALLEHAG